MSLALGGATGCGPKAHPTDPSSGDPTGDPATGRGEESSEVGPDGATVPAQQCVEWDAGGECTRFEVDEGGLCVYGGATGRYPIGAEIAAELPGVVALTSR